MNLTPIRRAGFVFVVVVALLVSACGRAETTVSEGNEATEATAVVGDATATEPTTGGEAPAVEPTEAVEGDVVTTASGLQYIEIEAGDGPSPQPGEVVSVNYEGRLEDGTVFDSSYDSGEPIQFPLGQGVVIPGWDEGIAMMQQGGKARLIIPPDLAYGATGAGNGVIPPNATLTFDVELVDILAGAPAAPDEVAQSDYTTTDSGLKYYDLQAGDGETPKSGDTVIVNYTGWLADGTKFDSSLDRGQPFQFVLGANQVIPGWDEGLSTMKIGGKRQLVIPPDLAYGAQGAGNGLIPPDATLTFDVELLGVNSAN